MSGLPQDDTFNRKPLADRVQSHLYYLSAMKNIMQNSLFCNVFFKVTGRNLKARIIWRPNL